jgi:hypothetical protein
MSEKGDCLKIGSTKATDRVVPHPAPPDGPQLRDDHGHMQACAGSQCRELGPTVTAAARKALALKGDLKIAPDLSLLVIYSKRPDDESGMEPAAAHLFSISRDRELTLPPPASYARDHPDATLDSVEFLGGQLLVSWFACASEECVRSAVFDAEGASLVKELGQSVGVALDDHRIAVAGNGDVIVLDRRTPRTVAKATFDAIGKKRNAIDIRGIVALSADEVAILWENQGDLRAARVKIGKKVKVTAPRKFPRCWSEGDL